MSNAPADPGVLWRVMFGSLRPTPIVRLFVVWELSLRAWRFLGIWIVVNAVRCCRQRSHPLCRQRHRMRGPSRLECTRRIQPVDEGGRDSPLIGYGAAQAMTHQPDRP